MARSRTRGRVWVALAWSWSLIFALILLLRILAMFGGPGYDLYDIPSGSMFPNLRVGDHIFALANVYANAVPPRGQVVVFKYPQDRQTDYVKRVVGLPGDRVQLRAGRLYINDQLVPREPVTDSDIASPYGNPIKLYRETLPGGASYLIAEDSDDGQSDNTEVFAVPDGTIFVLGDNRDHSADSRMSTGVGYVPLALLRDKPLFVYWSPDLKRIGVKIR
jgi:signal peptidase I